MVWFVHFQKLLRCLPLVIVVAVGCNPYDYQQGEFNAGPVDPANFPKAYLGDSPDQNVNGFLAGRGKFYEVPAFSGGADAGYYSFPFTDTQLKAADPLRLPQDPKKAPYAPVAYVFDPSPPTNPFPVSQRCTPPQGYQYDERSADMRYDEQGNIFTALPLATEKPGQASTFEYIPVVAEAAVGAAGLPCQGIKSEKMLNRVLGPPPRTGNFILWAIIDPSSGVYRVGDQASPFSFSDGGPNPLYSKGLSVQKWGWFGRYYLAYIDGGYVPIVPGIAPLKMQTQRIFIPLKYTPAGVRCGNNTCQSGQVCGSGGQCQSCTANPATSADACPTNGRCCPVKQQCFNPGANGTCAAIGELGKGYDILEFRRGDPNYSPVCEVRQYTANTPAPNPRPREIPNLPRGASDPALRATQAPTAESGIPKYIYCPQVN